MKRSVAVLLFVITFSIFSICPGCSENFTSQNKIETVTLSNINYFLPNYEVFVVSSDCTIKKYDFTEYWLNNPFSYFDYPLPPVDQYTEIEWNITEEKWQELIKILNKNKAFNIPNKMKPINGNDFPITYIEINTEGSDYRFGGYGAGYGKGVYQRQFREINDFLYELVKEEPVYIP